MFCRNCGNEIGEGAKFCSKCGTPIQVEVHVEQQEKFSEKSQLFKQMDKRRVIVGFVFIAIIAVVAIVLITRGMATKREVERLIKLGDSYYEAGSYSWAIDAYEEALLLDSHSQEARASINRAEKKQEEKQIEREAQAKKEAQAEKEAQAQKEAVPEWAIKKSEAIVGKEVVFGSYIQKAGKSEQGIEWTVLDVVDGKALLLSKYILEIMPWNEYQEKVYWKECTIRKWLNNSFYREAFSDEEKEYILENNDDYVFLLSKKEVENYSDRFDVLTRATDYAISGQEEYEKDSFVPWSLWGSVNYKNEYVVKSNNDWEVSSIFVEWDAGIRPAIWIELVE